MIKINHKSNTHWVLKAIMHSLSLEHYSLINCAFPCSALMIYRHKVSRPASGKHNQPNCLLNRFF